MSDAHLTIYRAVKLNRVIQLTRTIVRIGRNTNNHFTVSSCRPLNGHYLGKKAADAWNVRQASVVDEYPDLACGPQGEIFEKKRRVVLTFYVARSKARSFESMLGPG